MSRALLKSLTTGSPGCWSRKQNREFHRKKWLLMVGTIKSRVMGVSEFCWRVNCANLKSFVYKQEYWMTRIWFLMRAAELYDWWNWDLQACVFPDFEYCLTRQNTWKEFDAIQMTFFELWFYNWNCYKSLNRFQHWATKEFIGCL